MITECKNTAPLTCIRQSTFCEIESSGGRDCLTENVDGALRGYSRCKSENYTNQFRKKNFKVKKFDHLQPFCSDVHFFTLLRGEV